MKLKINGTEAPRWLTAIIAVPVILPIMLAVALLMLAVGVVLVVACPIMAVMSIFGWKFDEEENKGEQES